MTDNSRREFSRVRASFAVTVTAGKTVLTPDRTHDISMNGILLAGAPTFPAGTECTVSLLLGSRDSGERIDVRGIVARVTEDSYAVEFREIDPISFGHLRNLVRFNAESLDAVENELALHVGLKPA